MSNLSDVLFIRLHFFHIYVFLQDGSLDSSPSVTSSTDQGLTIKFNNNNGKDVVNRK